MVIIKKYFNKNERFSMKNVKKIVILSLLAMLCSSEQASPMISWFANLEQAMETFTNKIYLIDEEEITNKRIEKETVWTTEINYIKLTNEKNKNEKLLEEKRINTYKNE
jgi:hypothetical protein